MYAKIVPLALCVFLSCCVQSNRINWDEIRNAHVEIPMDSLQLLTPRKLISDNLIHRDPDLTFLIYVDSSSCSSCELKRLSIWHSIIKKAKRYDTKVNYLFIFCPNANEVNDFIENYYNNAIGLNIYIDSSKILERRNLLLHNAHFHTLLLDKEYNVVKIGNPARDAYAEKSFYKYLSLETRGDTLLRACRPTFPSYKG